MSKYAENDFSTQMSFGISLLTITAICVCLAWQSLSSVGAIRIFAFSFPMIFSQIFHNSTSGKTVILAINVITLLVLLYPKVLDVFVRYIGANNEQIFLLRTPKSVTLLTGAVLSFFWIVIYFIGINIEDGSIITAAVLSLFVIAVLAFFAVLTVNVIRRRLVVVPNGIVLCDPITLSDTILLPLSKLKNISTIKLSEFATSHTEQKDNEYIGNIGLGKVTQLSLIEKTDSFIIRKSHANTARQDIDELFISLVNPDAFETLFRDRFHGPERDPSTPLRSAQEDRSEKIEMLKMEKELGIETAPKSDAKLPEWRKKK